MNTAFSHSRGKNKAKGKAGRGHLRPSRTKWSVMQQSKVLKHLGDNGNGTVKTAAETHVSEIQPGIQSMKNLTLSVQRNGISGCGHKRGDGDGVTDKLPHIHAQKCHKSIL